MIRPLRGLVAAVAVLAAALSLAASPVEAFDPAQVYRAWALILSAEGGFGAQANIEDKSQTSDVEFWNAGVRVSTTPFGVTGSGPLRGAFEVGLEPFYQRYTEPASAFFAGLGLVGRYNVVGLGRFVPWVELFAGAGGTDLRVAEIRSDFTFVLHGAVGASVFFTDRAAVYAGYRFQHVSNGNTERPNRGFESHGAVAGVSYVFP
jgi:hypothetical protein